MVLLLFEAAVRLTPIRKPRTLRHYHRIGLLEPAYVDLDTGHRRYGTDQISTAQVIRRFRSLDMPLEEIHAVIKTPDLAARNELIAGHLRRLEMTLARTQSRHLRQRPVLPRARSGRQDE
jgi:DNA-binding transcriptional MerR regulator